MLFDVLGVWTPVIVPLSPISTCFSKGVTQRPRFAYDYTQPPCSCLNGQLDSVWGVRESTNSGLQKVRIWIWDDLGGLSSFLVLRGLGESDIPTSWLLLPVASLKSKMDTIPDQIETGNSARYAAS